MKRLLETLVAGTPTTRKSWRDQELCSCGPRNQLVVCRAGGVVR